jgi:hypothetical protein
VWKCSGLTRGEDVEKEERLGESLSVSRLGQSDGQGWQGWQGEVRSLHMREHVGEIRTGQDAIARQRHVQQDKTGQERLTQA